MNRVRIVTDAAAHLSPEFIHEHKLTVIPLHILFGDAEFRVSPTYGRDRLYAHMKSSPAAVSEATVPASSFDTALTRLSRESEEVLILLSSGELSNAVATAQSVAQAFLGRCRIAVMDSLTTSWGLGRVVQAAALAAADGATLDGIVRIVRGMLPHIYSIFLVERLDYLEQGRRVGTAQAVLGSILGIRPLILVEGGELIPLEKVRTRELALDKLVDFVDEFATIQEVVLLRSPMESETTELIGYVEEGLQAILPGRQFPVVEYDPVIACHLGPDALGVSVYEGM